MVLSYGYNTSIPFGSFAVIWYLLFAEILSELAQTISAIPPADVNHREALAEGAKAIIAALGTTEKQTVPKAVIPCGR